MTGSALQHGMQLSPADGSQLGLRVSGERGEGAARQHPGLSQTNAQGSWERPDPTGSK